MSKEKRHHKFHYQRPSKENLRKRAENKGGMFDNPVKSEYTVWSPKPGDNCIRILPATWEDAEHYGFDVYIHYGIGSDNSRYLCNKKQFGEDCPICTERDQATKEGEDDYAKELRANQRVAIWIVDRDDEATGPQIWLMPWTIDRDITSRCQRKKSGETLFIDHPEEGFDIEFSLSGKGRNTKYVGLEVARKSTPLSDDADTQAEWLEYISENPLPDCLNKFDEEYIAKVFAGKRKKDEDDEEEDERPKKRKFRSEDDEDANEKPRGKRKSSDDEDDEDDEETPRKKSKRSDDDDEDRPKKKSKRRDDEDIDDEDEELDEDDEDRPKKKAAKRKRDEDDEDEDDEQPVRSKVRDKIRKALDEDDEDDEETPRKKSKRSDDDDDDDDRPKKKAKRHHDDDDD